MRRTAALLVGCLALLSTTPLALAQEDLDQPPAATDGIAEATGGGDLDAGEETARPDRLRFDVRGRADHAFEADLGSDDGSVAISRASIDLGADFRATERLRIRFMLGAETSYYDWSGLMVAGAPADDIIQNANQFSLSSRTTWLQSDKWAFFFESGLRLAATDDGDLIDGLNGFGFGGVRYQVNKSLALAGGMGLLQRLEDDPFVVPLIGVEWQASEKVQVLVEGLGARVKVDLSDAWGLSIGGRYMTREFRLADDGPIPDGVLRDDAFPIELILSYNPSDKVSLSLIGGIIAWRELEFQDDGGDEVTDVNADPTALLGFRAEFRF